MAGQAIAPERPKVTHQMVLDAASGLIAKLGWEQSGATDIASAYRSGMDGYALGKELEGHYGWEIDSSYVDGLDGVDVAVRRVHRAACVEWVRENNIQPPFPVGSFITRGEITGLFEHDAACYLVRQPSDTDPTRRHIVRFEEAKAVA